MATLICGLCKTELEPDTACPKCARAALAPTQPPAQPAPPPENTIRSEAEMERHKKESIRRFHERVNRGE